MRGAWIEMRDWKRDDAVPGQSLPVRGAWIEIFGVFSALKKLMQSLPVRGAWIEIWHPWAGMPPQRVAPLMGSVD